MTTTGADWTPIPDARLSLATAKGLLIEASTTPDGPVLPAFYSAYSEAFVLPDETESYEGFAECLELNSGSEYARLSASYGPFREVVLTAREAHGNAVIGGANFIAFPLDASGGVLTINLNYIFTAAAERRRGHFRDILGAAGIIASRFFRAGSQDLPRLVFFEQNDPYQMSADAYETDSAHAGIDQMERLRLWNRLGARVLDFPYIQPALSDAQSPDASLVYSVLGAEGAIGDGGTSLDAYLVKQHLERFFAISVLKGRPLEASPVAASQIASLEASCMAKGRITLMNAAKHLSSTSAGQACRNCHRPASLREILRSEG